MAEDVPQGVDSHLYAAIKATRSPFHERLYQGITFGLYGAMRRATDYAVENVVGAGKTLFVGGNLADNIADQRARHREIRRVDRMIDSQSPLASAVGDGVGLVAGLTMGTAEARLIAGGVKAIAKEAAAGGAPKAETALVNTADHSWGMVQARPPVDPARAAAQEAQQAAAGAERPIASAADAGAAARTSVPPVSKKGWGLGWVPSIGTAVKTVLVTAVGSLGGVVLGVFGDLPKHIGARYVAPCDTPEQIMAKHTELKNSWINPLAYVSDPGGAQFLSGALAEQQSIAKGYSTARGKPLACPHASDYSSIRSTPPAERAASSEPGISPPRSDSAPSPPASTCIGGKRYNEATGGFRRCNM